MVFGNGVNLQPSYASLRQMDFAWSWMKRDPRIRTVRIEIEPDKVDAATGWIQQACGQGYEVIATYHSHSYLELKVPAEKDKPATLIAAAEWWKTNYPKLCSKPAEYQVQKGDTLATIAQKFYGQTGRTHMILHENRHVKNPTVLVPGDVLRIPAIGRRFTINLMNEWGSHDLNAQQYATLYNMAIGIVRSANPDLELILDLSGSGQETHVAACAAKGVGTNGVKLHVKNITFSAHIYRTSWVGQRDASAKVKQGRPVPADLDELASTNVPCIVGEFGSCPQEVVHDPAHWDFLVRYASASLRWPVLAWAWNGDGTGMNMIDPTWELLPMEGLGYRPSAYYRTVGDLL